ncbi:MAG TPA: HIT domain-containing protein, partial [Steroidobacteraceae bacterium]|nr:HIT domain-containing protein [Steroidobacteraceae bacterium]
MATIFEKIIAGEIPATIVYKDERVTAFRDISPQAPVHVLIVPNKPIPTANDVTEADEAVLGHMFV